MNPTRPVDALFVMPNLSAGGAERVAVTLLANLDPDRVRARLLLLDDRHAAWLDELPAHVAVESLNKTRLRESILPLIRRIRMLSPDLVFSMQWHLNAALGLARFALPTNTVLIGRETSMPGAAIQASRSGWIRHLIMRAAYPRLDAVLAQGQVMREEIARLAPGAASRIRILPNPVPIERLRARAQAAQRALQQSPHSMRHTCDGQTAAAPLQFVALGRLAPVKGVDRIIDAFALAALPNARLTILGDGPQRAELIARCDQLGLAGQIQFVGHQPDPAVWLARADALLMASHHEGFPNAALEAMACGTPVLAMPAPGGLAEALAQSPACRIAASPRTADLAALMTEFARAPRVRVAANALGRHNAPTVAAELASLFDSLLAQAR